ncbi:MAG: YbaB/EbfC family nucleoid-associated protein [Ahniella sp.]|nr:YbaB/EbfC family nucleoid-associated protein [Ahniella sp.]
MRGPLGNIMQQAQRMQENLKRAQDEIAKLEVTGQAGGGMVSVTMNGAHEVKQVKIDKAVVGDDIEMLEDLVTAAVNDAVNRIAELSKTRMADVAGGMSLPPGFKLPF